MVCGRAGGMISPARWLKDIMKNRFGIVPLINKIQEFQEFSEEHDLFFEYNDFFIPAIIDDQDEVKRRIKLYKSLGRDISRDTLHGVFFDMNPASDDPAILGVVKRRIESSMETAAELGVKGVVFHTNFIVNFRNSFYTDDWVEKCTIFYHELIEKYPGTEVYVENMFDDSPQLLARLGEGMKDCPSFGVCLDYAHANVFSDDPESFLKTLGPYVKHMHINDNFKETDDHLALGTGSIDWKFFKQLSGDYGIDNEGVSILIEMRDFSDIKHSVEFVRENL